MSKGYVEFHTVPDKSFCQMNHLKVWEFITNTSTFCSLRFEVATGGLHESFIFFKTINCND